MTQTILWPGTTLFGAGTATQLAAQAQALGVSNLFILYDPGVTALVTPILASLDEAGVQYTTNDKVIPNPDAAGTDAAAAAYRASGADCIVGIGGGSALDMAKGIRILAGSPEGVSVAEYLSTLGEKRRPNPRIDEMPPMIAIPTTSGTGSEVTPWGVVTDHETHQKAGIGTNLIPNVAILDANLTMTMPPHLTAATGMDALSHLVEAYVSSNQNLILNPLILQGIRLIGQYLRIAVAEPNNVKARDAMLEASMLGGVALSSNWLGACHSLAHQLSTFADMHHGLSCAIMLPPQMRWSLPGAPDRYLDVAQALDPSATSAEQAPDLVHQLNVDIGLPTRLSECGVTEDQIATLSKYAFIDLNWWTNPIQPKQDDLEGMYRAVF